MKIVLFPIIPLLAVDIYHVPPATRSVCKLTVSPLLFSSLFGANARGCFWKPCA